MDPLARVFGSPARLKTLRLFLFNQDAAYTLEQVSVRTKIGKELARKELAELVASTLLRKKGVGAKATYQVNPRFGDIAALDAFIRATTALKPASILEALRKAGAPRAVVLSGLFTGILEPAIDLLVVADTLDERALARGVHELESELGREIRYAAFLTPDFRYRMGVYDRLLRDVFDYPHRILVDKIGL